jgi:hypothetical protein
MLTAALIRRINIECSLQLQRIFTGVLSRSPYTEWSLELEILKQNDHYSLCRDIKTDCSLDYVESLTQNAQCKVV